MDGKLSHGQNAVISMVDHGLSVAVYGEESCSFHVDNCVGKIQVFNKKNMQV